MTITEALRTLKSASAANPAFDVALVCGFTPLHLQTFTLAHLQQLMPAWRVSAATGIYGDLCGTAESLATTKAHAVLLVLEWADLDSRLGYRGSGSWGAAAQADVLAVAQRSLDRLMAAVLSIPTAVRVVLCLPTLPLPPLFHTPGWQAGEIQLLLESALGSFAANLIGSRRDMAVVSSRRLDEESPVASRYSLKSDLLTGLPYTLLHADAVGRALARLAAPRVPKKGLITDLDDTVWRGIAGEVGPDGVTWDIANHTHIHALYQKLLASLAEQGVLIGVASKNDPAVVEKAFARTDILLPPAKVFPMEVHWNAKSASVARILETWNIGADSVVFVDDSPIELAEVGAAHPGIECLAFPRSNDELGYQLLRQLRDLFGKDRIAEEDALRLDSIRQGETLRKISQGGATPESFLETAESVISIDFTAEATEDPRALDLVNKTNQFNLNGRRSTEADWRDANSAQGAILGVVSYRDKFGPLGKIAVVQGAADGDTLRITTWVMSCRAFSRRIEHQCLKQLFDRTGAENIVLDYVPTAKNGPIRDTLINLLGELPLEGAVTLTRQRFDEVCPALYHTVAN